MAVRLLDHEVSDLCLGKPPLVSLPSSAAVRDVIVALRRCPEPRLTVWTPPPSPSCLGSLTLADLASFLAALADPTAALDSPIASLLPDDPSVRLIDPRSSVLEALDEILKGAGSLAVPLPAGRRQFPRGAVGFCLLTQEDFARFFLGSIGLLAPLAALTVGSLQLVRPAPLAIGYREPARAAAPLLRLAAAAGTAVAVVDDGGRLVGEISPAALALCGGCGLAAGALTALSAGEVVALTDCGRAPRDAVEGVKARLRRDGLDGLARFMDLEEEEAFSASSTSSSSSDEEPGKFRVRTRVKKVGSYSARMGRRKEEAIVCQRGSSLVAAVVQAVAHRVSYLWVVEEDYHLAGMVVFSDVLRLFRDHLPPPPPPPPPSPSND